MSCKGDKSANAIASRVRVLQYIVVKHVNTAQGAVGQGTNSI